MKTALTISILLLAAAGGYAQSGWTHITDPNNPVVTFTHPGIYKGAAWIDFDNDGDIDLFAAPRFLFRNDGNTTFTQVATIIGSTTQQNPSGCSWADLDNDGNIDCILSQYPSGLYKNNGNGTFTNLTAQVDSLVNYASWGCAIGNMNNDALPDLVYAHAAGFHTNAPTRPSRLVKSTGSGFTGTALNGYAFTDSLKPFTVPYWSDYDMDGDMDLFVASGPGGTLGPDFCYRNMKIETGLDTLYRMTTELFATQLQDGQCYNFIDADNDGDLDLCLTNYAGAATRFYVNTAGIFTSANAPFTGVNVQNLSNNWGDFDNDGDLDVLITNDNQLTKFYANNGSGTFSYQSNVLAAPAGAAGVTNGDFDNDGDLDIFLHGLNNAKGLYRNDSFATGNNWFSLKLTGVVSNRSAIGAFVKVKATVNGQPVWQIREVNAQNSFQSQNDLRVHIGLKDATVIDSLVITWPNSPPAYFTSLPVSQFYELQEGGTLAAAVHETTKERLTFTVFPNPAVDELNVKLNELHDKDFTWQISDTAGRAVMKGNYRQRKPINIQQLKPGSYIIRVEGKNTAGAVVFTKL